MLILCEILTANDSFVFVSDIHR